MNPITLPIAELKPALVGLGKVINTRSGLPVLKTVKVERTHDGWICLSATDLDHFVTVRLEQPAQGEPFAILIPHEELLKISRTCGRDESLHVEPAPDKQALIKFALAGQLGETLTESLPVDEFPVIPHLKCEAVPLSDHLRASVHEALECSSTDDTRHILQGAFIDVSKPNGHYVVATDGSHLYSSNSFRLPLSESLILPAHKFLDWKEFNNDGAWQLKVARATPETPTLVQIASRRWRFISRQIEGTYPNWRHVLPGEEAKTRVDFDPATAPQVMALINKMPCHDSQHSTIGIKWQEGKVLLLGRTPEASEWTTVEVPAAQGSGRELTVLFNRHYLLKALRFGLCHLDLIDEITPIRFSQEGRQMIVMPLRPERPSVQAPHQPEPQPVPVEQSATAPTPATTPTTTPERKPMLHNTNPDSSTPSGDNNGNTPPSLEEALTLVESLKDAFQNGLTSLKDLTTKLKQIQRDQKTSAKDLHQFRSTLRTLQSVKL